MIETHEEDKAAAEMEHRDGNYLLSVIASPLGATLSIEVEQKTDGRRWRGDFTARYIEDITQRAGNVKSFSNFVKMLRSATTSSSPSKSLHVDVLTYQDLEMLKDGRHKGNATVKKENSSSSNVPADPDIKRYLILTYITEFDRVHYPLPLLYEEEVTEETAAMKRCIQQLRSELESMKIRLKKYESSSKNSIASSNNSEDESLRNTKMAKHHDYSGGARPSHSTKKDTPQSPDTRALQERVKVLEDKLRTESMAHKKSITTLMRKNTLLEDEARKARVAERRMTERLRDNEFQLSLLRGRLKSLNCNGIGATSNNISPFPARRSQRTSASPPIRSRYVNQGLLRPSSTPPTTTRNRHIDQGRLRRPSTASPSGRYALHGPSSLPPRSRASSPMYSRHSTTPPLLKTRGRSLSCPTSSSRTFRGMDVHDYRPTSSSGLRKYKETDNWRPTSSSRLRKDTEIDYRRPTSSSHLRKDMEIEDWRQAASKQTLRCATPPRTTPRRTCDGLLYVPTIRRSSKNRRGDAGVNDAVSEVGEIDSRLFALQDYLKRMNSQDK